MVVCRRRSSSTVVLLVADTQDSYTASRWAQSIIIPLQFVGPLPLPCSDEDTVQDKSEDEQSISHTQKYGT